MAIVMTEKKGLIFKIIIIIIIVIIIILKSHFQVSHLGKKI
jgi:hypothetical protein